MDGWIGSALWERLQSRYRMKRATSKGGQDRLFCLLSLLAAAAKEPDPAKRFAILSTAEGMLVQDELPYLPLYQYGDGFLYDDSKIKGLTVNVRLMAPLKWIHRAE